MRSLSITSFFLFSVFSISFAAPAYGPTMPASKEWSVGVQTYQIFDRDLEDNNGDMESRQHFLLLSYGLTDWFCLDLKGGAGNIEQSVPNATDLVYSSYMAGGYGFRLRFPLGEETQTKLVAGFQHISVHPYTRNIGNDKHKAVLDDWQFSMLVARPIGAVSPYLGFRLSRMDYIYWKNGERNRIKSDLNKIVGGIIGLDIPLSEKTWINVEGQFLDASAVAGSVNYKF